MLTGFLDEVDNSDQLPELRLLPVPDILLYSNGIVGDVIDESLSPVVRAFGHYSFGDVVYRSGNVLGFNLEIHKTAVYNALLLDAVTIPELEIIPPEPEVPFNPIVTVTLCPDPVALSDIEECCREE
jgi:hypothetical protein